MNSCLQSTGILLSLDALALVSCLLFLCWHPLQESSGGAEIPLKTIYYFKTCPCLDLQGCCSSRIAFLTPICFFFSFGFVCSPQKLATGKQITYAKKIQNRLQKIL